MALIKCPECGRDVSDQAAICIYCGFPLCKAVPIPAARQEPEPTPTVPMRPVSAETLPEADGTEVPASDATPSSIESDSSPNQKKVLLILATIVALIFIIWAITTCGNTNANESSSSLKAALSDTNTNAVYTFNDAFTVLQKRAALFGVELNLNDADPDDRDDGSVSYMYMCWPDYSTFTIFVVDPESNGVKEILITLLEDAPIDASSMIDHVISDYLDLLGDSDLNPFELQDGDSYGYMQGKGAQYSVSQLDDGTVSFFISDIGIINADSSPDASTDEVSASRVSASLECSSTPKGKTLQENIDEYVAKENITLLSADDVRYDPINNAGKPFLLVGTIELSDYYNYFFSDMEDTHFSTVVTPTGGSYLDQWHIYMSRDGMSELFNDLKTGTVKTVALVAYIPETSNENHIQSDMAAVQFASWSSK